MSIYRGAGGAGDAVNDASSEAVLVQQLANEAQADADAAQASATAAAGSASTASTQATNASNSATAAASSASSASSSASTATTQATNAANSATAAQTAETNAETAETNAETAETNAETAASLAQEWATKLSTPVSGSDYSAKYNANLAATSATNASNSATAAAGSASTASSAADAALAALDSFDDRYLGQKSTAPTLDNDGNALLAGALYFNTTTNEMKVYDGSTWLNAYASLSGALLATNNLSDLNNTATARTNLGVAIGTNVQAWDADLDTWATKTAPSGTVVGTSDSQTLTNKTLTTPVISSITNTGTLTLPTSTDTLVGRATTDTLTNKTIALGSNTVSGTLAQFNTAVTDADLVSLAGTETLTNKTLTSPVVTGGSINNTIIGATTATTATFTTATVNRVADSQGGSIAPISSVMRNRIINGAMVIDQRNAGASVTPNNSYTLDRWEGINTQTSKYSVQQNAGSVTPPVGFTNYLGVTSLSAYTVGAAELFALQQKIEGFNFADLNWGTANAKTVTVSFWVRSSLTGTFGGSLTNSAINRSYPFAYTISAANTWETKSITIAGDTTGTWIGATNGIGCRLYFSLGSGSTYSGTAGSWSANAFTSATGATSVVGTNGATFYITGVQLEVGTQATSFEYRQYGTELMLCQRYFEIISGVFITTLLYPNYYYKVTKRVTPTFSNLLIDGGSGGTLATYASLDRTYQETANSVPSNFTSWASAEL